MLNAAGRYFHTLRHLQPRQILARAWFRLYQPGLPAGAPLPRAPGGEGWTLPPARYPSLIGPWRIRLLNRERELTLPRGWQDADPERLWLYNLHYFDDLAAQGAAARADWQRAWVARWIGDNPPVAGVGWEPYPLSLRAVNWIKWALAGHALERAALASLAAQLRHLGRRIEWHLLGNHLFANAKALTFGGMFLEGREPDAWLARGARILVAELAGQVLADGGHFERSPMYHALVLEDVLDLLNVLRAYPRRAFAGREALEGALRETASRMLAWLEAMCHPDGRIGFFNDCAFGVALEASQLRGYAAALGLAPGAPEAGSRDLTASGYARLQTGEWCVLFDGAPIGPEYIPGHAHADTLAFELSYRGERIVSNSGTSTYEIGAQRALERSTRAHATVEVDGEDSSEVWASFRVARRARPFDRRIDVVVDRASVSCAHDGYARLPGAPVHRRSLELRAHGFICVDRVEGSGRHVACAALPLHPGMAVEHDACCATLRSPAGAALTLACEGAGTLSLGEGGYAPEFGRVDKRPVLVFRVEGTLPLEIRMSLRARSE